MARWDYVTTAESDSEPGVRYDIKKRYADGHLGCGCKSYRFAPKASKTCKHVRAFLGGIATTERPGWATSAQAGGGVGYQVRVQTETETYTFTRRAITFDDELPIRRGA